MRFERSLPRIAVLLLTLGGMMARAEAPSGASAVQREFRGLWVATVGNIDWPSKPGLATRDQKAELTAIMDRAVELNLNVIILQVRPNCDAIYDSKLEPWSEYLTGQMGKEPRPYYDPLAFAVDEAHKRGLELHAWFNPFRARFRDSKTPVARNHVSMAHPDLVRTYGSFQWLDPTEPAARAYSLNVIMDVVRRYDIDGVHIDDKILPYPEKEGGREMEFPDGASWARYQKTGGKMSRNDWRRENVDLFVREVYDAIKKEKPWVKFGVSPFGIWQQNHPPGITGLSAYQALSSDSRKWLANGWLDYFAPQLYWPASDKPHSFPALLKWWADQNTQHRILVAGMRVNGWKGVGNEAVEASNEIAMTRKQIGVLGEILWHSAPLMDNRAGLAAALRGSVYSEPALVPACTWLNKDLPAQPILSARQSGRIIKLSWKRTGHAWLWVVRKRTGGRWTTEILPGGQTKEAAPNWAGSPRPEIISVSAVSRYGNMGEAATVQTDSISP